MASTGADLRRMRKAAGLSLRDVADLAGHGDFGHFGRVERGEREVTPSVEKDYARAIAAAKGDAQALRAAHHTPSKRADADLSAALSSLPTARLSTGARVGQEIVSELRERAKRMRRIDDFLGGADTFHMYRIELAETSRLIRECTYGEATERSLRSLAAEQAQQAGWAAFDAGNHTFARQFYKASMAAAHSAGDAALAGNALSMMSYQMITQSRSGVDAAVASRELTKDCSPAVQALMLERLAFAYANIGERRRVEETLAEAEAVLYRLGDRDEPNWVSWADEREFRLISGRCWADLHLPLRAIPLLESVLRDFDDSEGRNKAVYLTWLASAYIDAGEVDLAVATIGRVLDLADGIASARPVDRVTRLVRTLGPHQKDPVVSELLDRARGVDYPSAVVSLSQLR